MKWIWIMVVLAGFAGAVLYFAGDNPALTGEWSPGESVISSREPRSYRVTYTNGVFSPTNLRIHVSDAVSFFNENHEPLEVLFLADKKIISSRAFTGEGSYEYVNKNNESERGMIIVKP